MKRDPKSLQKASFLLPAEVKYKIDKDKRRRGVANYGSSLLSSVQAAGEVGLNWPLNDQSTITRLVLPGAKGPQRKGRPLKITVLRKGKLAPYGSYPLEILEVKHDPAPEAVMPPTRQYSASEFGPGLRSHAGGRRVEIPDAAEFGSRHADALFKKFAKPGK